MKSGTALQNRYRVERCLGEGCMGGVYLATHLELDTQVAIKVILVNSPGPDEIAQFRTEARILRRLEHPGLPRVSDFFEDAKAHYLVMDYIDGQTLGDLLNLRQPQWGEVADWTRQLCDVLHYLHTQDPPIIFRDLKPSNIMLDKNGRIRLIDFGLAKFFDRDTGLGTQTFVRGAGTPCFAAPEQYGVSNASRSGSDPRTDIYALGATIYCLLARQLPPQCTERASGLAFLQPLSSICPNIPPGLSDLVDAMMALNRNRRPYDVGPLGPQIEAYLTGRAADVVPLPPPPGGHPTVLPHGAVALATSPSGRDDGAGSMHDVATRRLVMGSGVGVFIALVAVMATLFMMSLKPQATSALPPPERPVKPVSLKVACVPPGADVAVNDNYATTLSKGSGIRVQPQKDAAIRYAATSRSRTQ